MNTSSAQVPVLNTFPPSLDSELGRFLVNPRGNALDLKMNCTA